MSRRLVATALAALALVGAGAASAGAAERPLTVVAYNVLAPIWAAPVWYPDELDPTTLATAPRRDAIGSLLAEQAPSTDVFCLQEVQDSELPTFLTALGRGWTGAMAENARSWWESYLVPELPWAPNGTAVLVREAAFEAGRFQDLPLAGAGNRLLLFTGVHRASGQTVRIASVHLDADKNANRLREARSLVERLPAREGTVDVICGDLNEDTVVGSVGNVLGPAGFVDVLVAVGNREPTHPFSRSYNSSTRWAVIDHVLVRGARPVAGRVIDGGVWEIDDETDRIEAWLRLGGSDHFALSATVAIAHDAPAR